MTAQKVLPDRGRDVSRPWVIWYKLKIVQVTGRAGLGSQQKIRLTMHINIGQEVRAQEERGQDRGQGDRRQYDHRAAVGWGWWRQSDVLKG